LTAAGQIMGTPQYMAPEQIEHPLQVDHRADIYSLGVVFYQMLTGELPVGRFAPPSKTVQIDVRLDEVVLRALEKEPDRRYQHAGEIKTRVETIAVTPGATGSASASSPDDAKRSGTLSANGTRAGDAIEQARRQIQGPAIGLLVTGILNWVTLTLSAIAMGWMTLGEQGPSHIMMLVVLISAFVCSIVMIFAALKMKRLQAYWLAIAASILAIIISPSNLIGLPIGVWALVVLTQREVRAAFRRKNRSDGMTQEGSTDSASVRPLPGAGGASSTPSGTSANHGGAQSGGAAASRIKRTIGIAALVLAFAAFPLSHMNEMMWGYNPWFSIIPLIVSLILGMIAWRIPAGKAAVIFSAFILLNTGPMLVRSATMFRNPGISYDIAKRPPPLSMPPLREPGMEKPHELAKARRDAAGSAGDLHLPSTIGASGTPASQAKPSRSRARPDRGAFEARLSNGVTVELLGVSKHPSQKDSWWRPDGSPLATAPCDPLKGSVDGGPDHVAREFVVHWHNLPSEPVGTGVSFNPSYNAYAGDNPKRLGKEVAGLQAMTVSLPDQPTVTVSVSMAGGPWQTVLETDGGSRSMGTRKGGFAFSPPSEKDGRVAITVTHDIIGPESRVVAVGWDGREHRASSCSSTGAHDFLQLTATFSPLLLKDIKVFRVQTRPYEQVEFRNVSLRPGHKTDVQIVIPGKSAAAGGSEAVSPESIPAARGEGTARTKPNIAQFRRHPEIFGPVVERTVEIAVSGKSAIDLDTGKLYTGPQVVKAFRELDEWTKTRGVDAVAMLDPPNHGLGGFDLIAIAVERGRWDISIAELKATLATGRPGTLQMLGKSPLPATYLFKTREDGIGVLQIVGFAEKPHAVRIRYKLLRKPVPAAAVSSDYSKARKIERLTQALEARRHGDEQTWQRVKAEIAAENDKFQTLLKGTVAEIPFAEQRERIEAFNKALHANDRQRMKELKQEITAAATALDSLIHGTQTPAENSTPDGSKTSKPADSHP
jgi:hypothetical protein